MSKGERKYVPKAKTGKCFYCGESTKLNIHQECGEKARIAAHKRRKDPKVYKYTDEYLDYLVKL